MTIADKIQGTHKSHHYCLLNSIMAMWEIRVVSISSGVTRPPNTIITHSEMTVVVRKLNAISA